MKYAVIDISSSSVSFIAAEVREGAAEVVFKDRIALSLRQYLAERTLECRGIDKLNSALLVAKNKCEALGVGKVYLIATAALRQIDNFEEVQKSVLDVVGMKINLIDGKSEGYYDLVANVGYAAYSRALLVDIGGASIEMCDFENSEKEDTKFLRFGIFDINRKFVKRIQPDKNEADKIKKYLKNKFDEEDLPKKGCYSTLVLVGATNLALYGVYSDFVKAEGQEKRIDVKLFKKLVKHLLDDRSRSALVLSSAPEKVYLVATAAIVLKTLFKRFAPENVVVSDMGVKEGYLSLILAGKENGECCDLMTEMTATSTEEGQKTQSKRKYTRRASAPDGQKSASAQKSVRTGGKKTVKKSAQKIEETSSEKSDVSGIENLKTEVESSAPSENS